jgi:uncharacterized protein YndB with AHSA1/START domain
MHDEVSVNEEIVAPGEHVWAMVSDVTRMGEWSPETEAGVWLKGATEATPGARFRGTNRNGKKHWSTTATVIRAEPGREFAFRVSAGGFQVAEWGYSLEPTSDGCRVTETWIDRRGLVTRTLGKQVTGVADRASHNRRGMEQTLGRLKAAAESTAPTA